MPSDKLRLGVKMGMRNSRAEQREKQRQQKQKLSYTPQNTLLVPANHPNISTDGFKNPDKPRHSKISPKNKKIKIAGKLEHDVMCWGTAFLLL